MSEEGTTSQTDSKQLGFFDGNPKMIFVFGLVAGIALTYVGGDILGGTSGRAVAADEDAVVVDDDDDDSGSTGTATAKTLAPVTDEDHVRGDIEKAKVVVVEYSDYECPFCGRHHPTMLDIMDKYGDDVAWVYRHFPLSFHPEAKPAALAAECAGEQDKFWEYTDELFANQDSLSDDYYGELADELGLNRSQFDDCVESEKYASKISEDTSSGRAAGVSGTPATFVNGQLVSGAVPLETFVDLIDAELE